MIVLFVAVLLSNPVSSDIFDASVEEQLLDCGWKYSIKKNKCKLGYFEFSLRFLASEVLRVSLCVRK